MTAKAAFNELIGAAVAFNAARPKK